MPSGKKKGSSPHAAAAAGGGNGRKQQQTSKKQQPSTSTSSNNSKQQQQESGGGGPAVESGSPMKQRAMPTPARLAEPDNHEHEDNGSIDRVVRDDGSGVERPLVLNNASMASEDSSTAYDILASSPSPSPSPRAKQVATDEKKKKGSRKSVSVFSTGTEFGVNSPLVEKGKKSGSLVRTDSLGSMTPHKLLVDSFSKPLQAFFAPLQKVKSDVTQQLQLQKRKGAFHQVRTAVLGFFLLDTVEYKNIAVWLGAYHYLPVIACVLALTVNAILYVFFSIMFPLMDDHGYIQDSTLGALWVIAAHMGVLIGCATVGYKVLSVITDAMVDSLLVVVDPQHEIGVPFYSLFLSLRTILASQLQTAVFASSMTLLLLSAYMAVFTPYFGFSWEENDWSVFYCAACASVVAAVWLAYSWILRVEIGGTAPAVWWSRMPTRARRRSIIFLGLASVFFCIESGLVHGVSCFCEGMLYLNVVHIVIGLATKFAMFSEKVRRSIVFFFRNPGARRTLMLLMIPWCGVVGSSFYFFHNVVVSLLQLPPILVMITSIHSFIKREQNFDASLSDAPISTVVRLGMKSYLCNTKHAVREMPHFKAGLLIRIVLRTTLMTVILLIWILAVWVSVQYEPSSRSGSSNLNNKKEGGERSNGGATASSSSSSSSRSPPTSCEAIDESGDNIIVKTGALHAFLYGMKQKATPEQLVYEENKFLYDGKRYDGLCQRDWYGINALDLALFSIMSYLTPGTTDFSVMLDFYRKYRDDAEDWVHVPAQKRVGTVIFHHFYSQSKNVSVIAVRGTDVTSPRDFLQNILIFSETFIFQMLAVVVPGSSFLPDRSIIDFIAAASLVDAAILGQKAHRMQHHYYHGVEEYVSKIPGNVVLTGHSLGGVVAQIVGARMRMHGVGFGAPGYVLMQKKFGIDPLSVDAYTSNVAVSNDMTTRIDRQGGAVFHIQCEHKRGDICHSIELQAIRLWTMCNRFRAETRMNGTYTILPQPHEVLSEKFAGFVSAVRTRGVVHVATAALEAAAPTVRNWFLKLSTITNGGDDDPGSPVPIEHNTNDVAAERDDRPVKYEEEREKDEEAAAAASEDEAPSTSPGGGGGIDGEGGGSGDHDVEPKKVEEEKEGGWRPW